MDERYEIYYWTPAQIRQYENDIGLGLFEAAVNSCDYDVATYGECIGGCDNEDDVPSEIYNYFGNTSYRGYIGIWDNDEEEWI